MKLFDCLQHYNFVFRKYEFALEEVEGFRYRSRDAWRAVTRIAVREARLKEIKQELINCKKLQVSWWNQLQVSWTNKLHVSWTHNFKDQQLKLETESKVN